MYEQPTTSPTATTGWAPEAGTSAAPIVDRLTDLIGRIGLVTRELDSLAASTGPWPINLDVVAAQMRVRELTFWLESARRKLPQR